MLGNYCYILTSQVLTGPHKTGSNPELANRHNKRLIIFKEPDKDQKFNIATVKEIIGGANINARLNYSNETETKFCLTFIGGMNEKPKASEDGDAFARRILDIPFKNKFIDKDEYDELNDEEKKQAGIRNDYYKTTEFKDKYKQALFTILIEHHKEFLKNNRVLVVPPEIVRRNREYLANSDEFLGWFETNFEKKTNQIL